MAGEESLAARLERLAARGRAAQDLLRGRPDCLYQDTGSVFLKDSKLSRKALANYKSQMNDLYGCFGIRTAGTET